MDQLEQSQQQVVGSVGHMAYATPPFHVAPVVVTGTPTAAVSSPTQLPPISTSINSSLPATKHSTSISHFFV